MKYILSLLLSLSVLLPEFASAQQGNDQRTLTTKIADILAKFPAADKKQYDANIDQLEKLGNDGLKQMLAMLSPEGKGNNTALEYAISAYSSAVMQKGGRERNTAIDVYCNSLKSLNDPANLTFIIRQLQLVGNESSLACLEPLLEVKQQAGPAARAMAQTGLEAAGQMLLKSLNGNSADKASVIEALGYIKYAAAADAIEKAFQSGDDAMKRVAGYALANIASPSSAKLLHDAAKKESFKFDNSASGAVYLNYLQQLSASEKNRKQAATLAEQMMSEAATVKNTSARIAGLSLVAAIKGKDALPLIYKAVSENDNQYRGAALKLAGNFRDAAPNKKFVSLLKNAKPEAKVQIIRYLSETREDASVASAINIYLNDKDTAVRRAAIAAVPALNEGKQAIGLLTNALKANNKEDFPYIKAALKRVDAGQFGTEMSGHVNGLPPAAMAASLDVLADRKSVEAGDKVLSLLSNSDTTISNAAYRALPSVVDQEDLPRLYTLLNDAAGTSVKYVQNAITAASAQINDTAQRAGAIIRQLNSMPSGKRYLFAPTLAAIGGSTALSQVQEVYNNGDAHAKKTVIGALSENQDAQSASMLLSIAKEGSSNRKEAVDGYISIIQRGNFPADQKVLMLQEAMELADSDAQRKKILQEAGRNRTYQSLLFAGKYINESSLQQEAGMAIMNIALAHPEFNGNHVRQLLEKVSSTIKGQDSQYQREAIRKHLAEMPAGEGFVPLFNGKDLNGWKGLVENPVKRAAMTPKALAEAQKKADAKIKDGWQVKDGLLVFTGHGDNLATVKQYEDFEMLVDWKITAEGDAGIYLRGTPQVQIWDTSRHDVGAQVGSGGLYNNEKNPSKPLVVADNPIGEWNTFRIIMKGDKVTVYLNGKLVTDNVVLENYWDRSKPLFPREQMELQAHGTYVAYRNIYLKELPSSRPFELSEEEKKENYELLFNGTNLDKWTGNKKDYVIEGNELVIKPSEGGGGGNLFTEKEYSDFIFRFEFMLTPGANNGLGIRAPLEGDAAYTGMELQILDNDADIYKDLKPYQYHGSVYGVIPAKRGHLKPIGEWNYQEVMVKGTKIKITLNGTVILDGDLADARKNGTLDKQDHPGIHRDKGHIGFLGHGSVLRFRNIRVKEL